VTSPMTSTDMPPRHLLRNTGTAMATAGAIATIPMHLGPSRYPITLALTGLPLTWLGGVLYVKTTTRDRGIG